MSKLGVYELLQHQISELRGNELGWWFLGFAFVAPTRSTRRRNTRNGRCAANRRPACKLSELSACGAQVPLQATSRQTEVAGHAMAGFQNATPLELQHSSVMELTLVVNVMCRGPTGVLLNELAEASFDYANCRIIFVRILNFCFLHR